MTNERKSDIERISMPLLQQQSPFDAKILYDEVMSNPDAAYAKYRGYRLAVTGIASKIGPDIHGKPVIEISDEVGGHCYVLAVFPNEDVYSRAFVGHRVTVLANYMLPFEPFGVVMKFSELSTLHL